jgi:hypothetical protein
MRCCVFWVKLTIVQEALVLSLVRADTNGGNRIFCNAHMFYHTTRYYVTSKLIIDERIRNIRILFLQNPFKHNRKIYVRVYQLACFLLIFRLISLCASHGHPSRAHIINPLTPKDKTSRSEPLKIKIPSKNMREKSTNTPIIQSVY